MNPPPNYLLELVLPTRPVAAHDAGNFDLYLPDATPPAPLVVLVHGGPMRDQPASSPRQWPVYAGYAAALAARGAAVAMFDHDLLQSVRYADAATQLDEVVAGARAHPGVDGNRVALWFFSGGGPLAARAMRAPSPWLRAIAFSYAMLLPLGDVEGFRPIDELHHGTAVPILFTRVGHEHPPLATAQDEFVSAARNVGADLTVIDVADGHHAFDVLDDDDASRSAIVQAVDFVAARLA